MSLSARTSQLAKCVLIWHRHALPKHPTRFGSRILSPTWITKPACQYPMSNLHTSNLYEKGKTQSHQFTVPENPNEEDIYEFDGKKRTAMRSQGALTGKFLSEFLLENHTLDEEFWPKYTLFLEEKDHNQFISRKFWQSQAMLHLTKIDDDIQRVYKLATLLLEHCRKENLSIPVTMRANYLYILSIHDPRKHLIEINEIYKGIMEETGDILDLWLANTLIQAYAQTSDWKKCYDVIDIVQGLGSISTSSYSSVAEARFRAGDFEEGWNILHQIAELSFVPEDNVYSSLINHKNFRLSDLEHLLGIMRQYQWFLPQEAAANVKLFFEDANEEFIGEHTEIKSRHRGYCPTCGTALEPLQTISDKDFSEMRDAFLEKALKRGDVFKGSTPEELQHFSSFIEEHGPFDVVVDGLNVAFKGNRTSNVRVKAQRILSAINTLTENEYGNRKVLMICREHALAWSMKTMDKIKQKAYTFWPRSMSEDDPFILYAALHSGPKTLYVSSDEMRDHRFLLGTRLADIFKLWQRGHQVQVMGTKKIEGNNIKVFFLWPKKHDTRVQRSESGWHIPVVDEVRASYELPETWLCMRNSSFPIENKRRAHKTLIQAQSRKSAQFKKKTDRQVKDSDRVFSPMDDRDKPALGKNVDIKKLFS